METRRPTRLPVALALAAVMGLALTGPVAAQIQAGTVSAVPAHAYPGDRVGIPLFVGSCITASQLDPASPPRVILLDHVPNDPASGLDDVYTYRLEYALNDRPGAICGTPPPPSFSGMTDVGALPPGLHQFEVQGFLGDAPYVEYDVAMIQVGGRDRPGQEISGAWYAPSQSGRGVFVLRARDVTTVYWATHDADGNPAWVLMTPQQDDNLITGPAFNTAGTPLAPGAATLTEQAFGTLAFEYLGCGRARLAWDALDPAITDGEVDLVQLASVDGVQACAPSATAVAAVWDEDAR